MGTRGEGKRGEREKRNPVNATWHTLIGVFIFFNFKISPPKFLKFNSGPKILKLGFDMWPPRSTSFKSFTHGPSKAVEIRDLFLVQGVWNDATLSWLFLPVNGDIVKVIPLSFTPTNDRLIWNYEKCEEYFVWS